MAYNSYVTSANRNTSRAPLRPVEPQEFDPFGINVVPVDIKETYTNRLREYFKEGRTIKAEHFLQLQMAIDEISAHTHDYTDYYMIGVFGDGAGRGDATKFINRTTSASKKSDGTALSSNTFTATQVRRGIGIQDTHFNWLKDKINDLREHTHEYTDYYNQDSL